MIIGPLPAAVEALVVVEALAPVEPPFKTATAGVVVYVTVVTL